jgi:hypothetical protein
VTNIVIPAIPEGFGRATEKLADTVRHVVDLVAGPKRIRAKAQAQADADAYALVVRAQANTEAKEIESRALMRLRKRETRRQNNIESITEKAILALPPPDQISSGRVNDDWTSRFFGECQDISDEQMQQLWARILAGEVAQPGTFSPRTLSVVRDLTTADANLFASLCSFIWTLSGWDNKSTPIIHDFDAPSAAKAELYYPSLMHLSSIGLIEFNSVTPFLFGAPGTMFTASYFGKVHQLQSDHGAKRDLPIGRVVFTAVGGELVEVCNAVGNEEIEKAAVAAWGEAGWKEVPAPESTQTGS